MKTSRLTALRPGLIEDLDLAWDGSVVAFVRTGAGGHIVGEGWDLERLPPLRFPCLRVIDDSRVLLVDTRTADDTPNAWILDRQGEVLAHFLAGDAIQDVVVSPPFIAVTYFDEAYSSRGPGGEGVSFFDFEGHLLWGYRAQFGAEAADVVDVYAAASDEAGCLWFYPYTEFPLIRLDLHAREQTLFTPPELLHGSNAVSIHDATAYFVGPYERRGYLFEWPLGAPEARRLGTLHGAARGLPGGRFIALREGKWSLVEDVAAP